MSMVDTNQQQSFPNMPTPVVDDKRMVTDPWRYFFTNLWARTGGATGGTVVGPTNSTIGDIPIFNNTGGTALADSGYGIDTSGHNVAALDGANTFSATQRVLAGAIAAPGLAVGPGLTQGLYSPGVGQLGVTLLGTLRMLWNGALATITGSLLVTANVSAVTVTASGLITGGQLLTPAVLVAALPVGAAVGTIASVSNASAPVIGSVVVGGGTVNALVWWNGSQWTVIGV